LSIRCTPMLTRRFSPPDTPRTYIHARTQPRRGQLSRWLARAYAHAPTAVIRAVRAPSATRSECFGVDDTVRRRERTRHQDECHRNLTGWKASVAEPASLCHHAQLRTVMKGEPRPPTHPLPPHTLTQKHVRHTLRTCSLPMSVSLQPSSPSSASTSSTRWRRSSSEACLLRRSVAVNSSVSVTLDSANSVSACAPRRPPCDSPAT
jgi:hypothetical protein